MKGNPLDFNPDLYLSPEIFEMTLDRPFVTAIGGALDEETFKLVQERAREVGRNIGAMTLARKETGENGDHLIDWFPVYTEETLSLVGKYTFDAHVGVTLEQVEAAETFIFTRPEFSELSEQNRRRNVIRLSLMSAHNEASLNENPSNQILSFGFLIGPGLVQLTSTLAAGKVSHLFELGEERSE